MHILALKWKCQYLVGPFIYVLFLLSQKKQTTALFLLCLHLIMSLLLQLSSLSPSSWLSPWQQNTSQGMVSAASFSKKCLLVLMEFLCRIHIYRNFNVTLGISVPSSHFSHFFFFSLQQPLTKSKSSSWFSYILCAGNTWVGVWEWRGDREFWQQIKIFPKSGIMKRFTKVHFYVLRCFKML